MLKRFSAIPLAMVLLLSVNTYAYANGVSESKEIMSLEPLPSSYMEGFALIEEVNDNVYGEYKVYKSNFPVIRKAHAIDMEGLAFVDLSYDDTYGMCQIYKSNSNAVQILGADQIVVTDRLYCKFNGHIIPTFTEYFDSIPYEEIEGYAGGYLNARSYFHGFDDDSGDSFTLVEYHGTMFKLNAE